MIYFSVNFTGSALMKLSLDSTKGDQIAPSDYGHRAQLDVCQGDEAPL